MNILSSGAGYDRQPEINFIGGSPVEEAQADAVIDDGQLVAIDITNGLREAGIKESHPFALNRPRHKPFLEDTSKMRVSFLNSPRLPLPLPMSSMDSAGLLLMVELAMNRRLLLLSVMPQEPERWQQQLSKMVL